MNVRTLLAALALTAAIAACNEVPTATRTPSAPAFDGGSFGPGALTGDGSATTQDGGSFGPGALTDPDSTDAQRGGSFGPGA